MSSLRIMRVSFDQFLFFCSFPAGRSALFCLPASIQVKAWQNGYYLTNWTTKSRKSRINGVFRQTVCTNLLSVLAESDAPLRIHASHATGHTGLPVCSRLGSIGFLPFELDAIRQVFIGDFMHIRIADK
jgi:hypothetical protein